VVGRKVAGDVCDLVQGSVAAALVKAAAGVRTRCLRIPRDMHHIWFGRSGGAGCCEHGNEHRVP
jgi:hypothetical protein